MDFRLENIPPKKLVGKRLSMSLTDNRTVGLWRSFMPARKEIRNTIGSVYYSLQILSPSYFDDFNPDVIFEKWALVEVQDFGGIPEGMEAFELQCGLYAVFLHIGGPATAFKTFQYIFSSWLPGSGYVLDDRPHFEILGEKYKNGDPESEEEIWIPVKVKD